MPEEEDVGEKVDAGCRVGMRKDSKAKAGWPSTRERKRSAPAKKFFPPKAALRAKGKTPEKERKEMCWESFGGGVQQTNARRLDLASVIPARRTSRYEGRLHK